MNKKISEHRLYKTWNGMMQRTLNKNHPRFKDWGGRGIFVCEEWRDANAFFKWCNDNGYKDGLTIDRIDNDKGYSPDNCRFATKSMQVQNCRLIRSNNSSGYRGVSKNGKGWLAQINVSNRHFHLGTFETKEHAAMAYDTFVIVYGLNHTQNFKIK